MDDLKSAQNAIAKKTFFGSPAPQYDVALPLFEQAANSFRNSKDYVNAIKCLIEASTCHLKLDSVFLAAKNTETAASLTQQYLNDPSKAMELYKTASHYYLTHGSSDRAAEMMEKAAIVFQSDPKRSLELYKESVALYDSEDRLKFGLETIKRAFGFALKSNLIVEALELLILLESSAAKVSNAAQFQKGALSHILLLSSLGRVSEANTVFNESCIKMGSFVSSEEGVLAHGLLEAIESGQESLLKDALKAPTLKFLDNELVKLYKTIKVVANPNGPTPEQPDGSKLADDIAKQVEEEGFC